MRKNCGHCGVEQYVSDDKLAAGWTFLKCHQCGTTATIQGRASLALSEASEKKLRSRAASSATPSAGAGIVASPSFSISTSRSEQVAMVFPPVPEFLKAEKESAAPLLSAPVAPPQTKIEENIPTVPRSVRSRLLSNSVPMVLALACIGSGAYLVQSVKRLTSKPPADERILVEEIAPTVKTASIETAASVPPAAAPVAKFEPSKVNRSPAIVSRIDLPVVGHKGPPAKESMVEVKAANAVLRSGPGTGYGKVGSARAELQLLVKGSFENWFEVHTDRGTAWIRGDLVRPVAQIARGDMSQGEVR